MKNIAKQHCETPELSILEKPVIAYTISGTNRYFNQLDGLTNLYPMNVLGVKLSSTIVASVGDWH